MDIGDTSALRLRMIIPGLRKRDPRPSKVCSPTQGHRASLWKSCNLRPGLPDAKGPTKKLYDNIIEE